MHQLSDKLFIGRSNGGLGCVEPADILDNDFDIVIQLRNNDDPMSSRLISLVKDRDGEADIIKKNKDSFIRHSLGNNINPKALYYYDSNETDPENFDPEELYKLWLLSHHLKVCILYENDETHQYAIFGAALAVAFHVFSNVINGVETLEGETQNVDEIIIRKANIYCAAQASWYAQMIGVADPTYASPALLVSKLRPLINSLLNSFVQRYIRDSDIRRVLKIGDSNSGKSQSQSISSLLSGYINDNANDANRAIKIKLLSKLNDLVNVLIASKRLDVSDVIKLALATEMILLHPATYELTDKLIGNIPRPARGGGNFVKVVKQSWEKFKNELQVSKPEVGLERRNELLKMLFSSKLGSTYAVMGEYLHGAITPYGSMPPQPSTSSTASSTSPPLARRPVLPAPAATTNYGSPPRRRMAVEVTVSSSSSTSTSTISAEQQQPEPVAASISTSPLQRQQTVLSILPSDDDAGTNQLASLKKK
jgi:hypothetical protein